MTIKVENKVIILSDTLKEFFGNKMNLARIKFFGSGCIECLLADREFIGDKWLEYLNRSGIEYHIRIRDNFRVEIPRNGHMVKACLNMA